MIDNGNVSSMVIAWMYNNQSKGAITPEAIAKAFTTISKAVNLK